MKILSKCSQLRTKTRMNKWRTFFKLVENNFEKWRPPYEKETL